MRGNKEKRLYLFGEGERGTRRGEIIAYKWKRIVHARVKIQEEGSTVWNLRGKIT